KKSIVLLVLLLAVYFSFSSLKPSSAPKVKDDTSFSSERAMAHLKTISETPHYVGADAHDDVKKYITRELQALGLSTATQEGYSINTWGNMTKPKNIIARIEGTDNSKALMLLTHYDSSAHSSYGASDAGSGVVTILEGLRAFLASGKPPKNDIIVLISDAEELGLNGADIFVNHHPWAKDVGLVLNFEARGSGGPSYMLMETNGGNKNMIKGFMDAHPKYPVANSLAYSIYKLLPNDTDLTRFREDGDIDGFNLAFIDDHFDYHTALDTYDRLDESTLAHQASYMMSLLTYFADANLNNMKSDSDYIYFNVPLFKMVSYPYVLISPMLILSILAFLFLVLYGIKKRKLSAPQIGKGFVPFLAALLINILIGYLGWMLLKLIYPRYNEMLHGFTYNGHTYIWAFSFLALGVCLYMYHKSYKPRNAGSLLVAPLFFWLILCTGFAFALKGASFFIVPVMFALVALFVLTRQRKPKLYLMALLSLPLLLMMSPFVKMFPVGLGLGMLMASTLMITLIFSLAIPVFAYFRHKNRWAYVCFALGFVFLVTAHFQSGFNEERPKPNSLVYALNTDDDSAVWGTYDQLLDPWTKAYLTDNPNDNETLSKNTMESKYNTRFTYSSKADVKPIPQPLIERMMDTVIDNLRHVRLYIAPQRIVNRIEVFSDTTNVYNSFKINGLPVKNTGPDDMAFGDRWRNRLFTYYVADENYLDLEFSVPKDQKTTMEIYESSFDLIGHPQLKIPKRPKDMIPKPFILNDAVIIKKTITIE
ncbi:MAG: M28 family peptidase, partial [Bacteroidota bacterium]